MSACLDKPVAQVVLSFTSFPPEASLQPVAQLRVSTSPNWKVCTQGRCISQVPVERTRVGVSKLNVCGQRGLLMSKKAC